MKKIAIFVITLSLCLSLAACNTDKSSKDSTSKASSDQETSANTEESTTTEKVEETTTTASTTMASTTAVQTTATAAITTTVQTTVAQTTPKAIITTAKLKPAAPAVQTTSTPVITTAAIKTITPPTVATSAQEVDNWVVTVKDTSAKTPFTLNDLGANYSVQSIVSQNNDIFYLLYNGNVICHIFSTKDITTNRDLKITGLYFSDQLLSNININGVSSGTTLQDAISKLGYKYEKEGDDTNCELIYYGYNHAYSFTFDYNKLSKVIIVAL